MPDRQATGTNAPTITVIIMLRDRIPGGMAGVQALLAQPSGVMELLILDQISDEAVREAVLQLAATDARVRYQATGSTTSSVARNLGAAMATGDIVAFVGEGCVVGEGWLDAIRAEFLDSRVAAVFGRLLAPEQGRRTPVAGAKDSMDRQVYDARTPPWYIGHGPNMAFRRADLLEIDGFDPLLGAGGPLGLNEDGDVAYRLLAAGKQVAYSPKAIAWHASAMSWSDRQRVERSYGVGAGAQFAKYLRCGDGYGWQLLRTWIRELGMRRLVAGCLKWRSWQIAYLGYCQLVYPWVGIWRSWRYPVDEVHVTYVYPQPRARRFRRTRRHPARYLGRPTG